MHPKLLLMAFFMLLLSACALPLNPAEFRQAAKTNAALHTSESFEVNRPLGEVARTFKEKGPECLDFKLGSAKRGLFGDSVTNYYAQSKQTVFSTKDRAELHFQVHYKGTITSEPDGGYYFLVADAYSIGKSKTRVDIYRRTSVDLLLEAVKGWASGDNLGCPDPTQYM